MVTRPTSSSPRKRRSFAIGVAGPLHAEQSRPWIGGEERLPADEVRLVEVDERAEARPERGHRRIDIRAVVEDPRLDPADPERLEALHLEAVRRTGLDDVIPECERIRLGARVDLESELTRPARP